MMDEEEKTKRGRRSPNRRESARSRELMHDQLTQLHLLSECFPGFLWKALPDGRVTYVNRYCEDYMGLTAEQIGAEWMRLIHPDDRDEVGRRWIILVGGGQWREHVFRLMGKDGEYRWFQSRITTIKDDSGAVVALHGLTVDANEIVNAERSARSEIDALKEAERVLQLRERQLQGIIETVPAMIWTVSPTGETTHINRRVREYSGMSLEDFADLGWESYIHPDDFEGTVTEFFRAIQTGESYNGIHRLRRFDGEYRWHHAMDEPLRDSDGKIIQWYGLCVDIDDSKRAEDHLRETRAKLNRASRIAMVAELSASIAHELNQPLMSVLANAQAIQRWLAASPPNLEEVAASVERIVRDSQAADQTMQNIRALFGREPFEKKEASVPEMVREAVRLVQENLNKQRIPVEYVFEAEPPMVFVDPIQIQEVLINLIANAMDAVENIPREPQVVIKARMFDGHFVAIQVIDNGPGVDNLERIFDAFVTTKEKGMGIGLAVSRSIVEAHEGELRAENSPDFGATFTLTIPTVAAMHI